MQIEQLYQLYMQSRIVTTDSRNCPEGSIFFALRGANFNGNLYAHSALEKGCSYAVVDEKPEVPSDRIIVVDDVLTTLQQLARHHRTRLDIPFVGITGTNGKTTTKELIASVLKQKYRTHFTQGNLNNHIGVPLTILAIQPDCEIAVIEMGANHPGEIRTLVDIALPTHGLITNIGSAHLEGFGSLDGVMNTKRELYDNLLRRGSTIFLNTDDSMICEAYRRSLADLNMPLDCTEKTITYSSRRNPEARYQSQVTACTPFVELDWHEQNGENHHVATQLIGSYNINNITVAIAIGSHFGIDTDSINRALAGYAPQNNRSQLTRTERNTLIVDAYNANPSSMHLAIENFAQLDMPHKVMILGDMRELGTDSLKLHKEILTDSINPEAFESVILVGKEFGAVNSGFQHFDNCEALIGHLNGNPLNGKTILIKGSNGMKLYTLPSYL